MELERRVVAQPDGGDRVAFYVLSVEHNHAGAMAPRVVGHEEHPAFVLVGGLARRDE